MTCLGEDDVIALLSGGLKADAFEAAEQHLDRCRSCRLLVSTLAARTGDQPGRRDLGAFTAGDLVADRYRIVALLGTGGMGEVYEAFDVVLGETIALKTIAAGTTLNAGGVSRLKAEVQLARRITHRNVCRVFDVGFQAETGQRRAVDGDGTDAVEVPIPFFTMELLRGETLRARIQRAGPYDAAGALALLEQIAAAIDAAHAAGVVHTDLKSENVMLVDAGGGGTRAVVMDFGLARLLDERGRSLRLRGSGPSIAGTFGYMAPEQLAGAPTGPAADIYALGVVMFEMLTGRLPVAAAGLLAPREQAQAELRRSVVAAELPPGWRPVIQRCTEPDPAMRFVRAGLVLAAASSSSSSSSSSGGERRQPRRGARAPASRRMIAAATIGVAVAVVGGGGLALVGAGRRQPPVAAPASPPPSHSTPVAAPAAATARPQEEPAPGLAAILVGAASAAPAAEAPASPRPIASAGRALERARSSAGPGGARPGTRANARDAARSRQGAAVTPSAGAVVPAADDDLIDPFGAD